MALKQTSSLTRWLYPKNFDQMMEAEETGTSLVPELIYLGSQKNAEAFPLTLHRHDHGYEFVYLEQGSVTWELNGVHYPTSAGQWFFTFPGELHKARFNHMEPSRIWWFIMKDPAYDPNWFRMDTAERESIIARLSQLPRVFRASNRVREQFMRLKATLENGKPG
jgi:hypothetical protein